MVDASTNEIRIEVATEETGQRLDKLLADTLQLPRNRIQRWIREDRILVDGRSAKPSHSVQAGETITCRPDSPSPETVLEPEPGDLELLYEDAHLLVLNKPSNLVVHPGAGRTQGTLVHRLLTRYPEIGVVGHPRRPGVVHRLDKDTTGLLLVARTDFAYRSLSASFAERRVEKRYLAIVYGQPGALEGTISEPIGRHPRERKQMAIRAGGRPASTHYRSLRSRQGLSLLELDLETGRTHQIRVHLKAFGLPLVGDPVYGEARWKGLPKQFQKTLRDFPRPALHAWRLRLPHPDSEQTLSFEAPVPADLIELWKDVTGSDLGEALPRAEDPKNEK